MRPCPIRLRHIRYSQRAQSIRGKGFRKKGKEIDVVTSSTDWMRLSNTTFFPQQWDRWIGQMSWFSPTNWFYKSVGELHKRRPVKLSFPIKHSFMVVDLFTQSEHTSVHVWRKNWIPLVGFYDEKNTIDPLLPNKNKFSWFIATR